MKTLSAAMLAHLNGEVTSLARCLKVTLTDTTVLGFTDHDQTLAVSGTNYISIVSYSSSELQSSSQLNVDNVSVAGQIDGTIIVADQIRAGRWDYAQVEIFAVNHADLTMGIIPLRKGRLGEQRRGNVAFESELRGLMQFLQQTIGRLYMPTCDADLYEPRCGVRNDPPVWTASTAYTANVAKDAKTGSLVKPTSANGCYFLATVTGTSGGSQPSWNVSIGGSTSDGSVTWKTLQSYQVSVAVTSVASQRLFTASAIQHPDAWFTYGVVTFTSGLNAGYSMEVKTHVADGSGGIFTLQQSMPYLITAGDLFTVKAGCDLVYATCKSAKFDNGTNFQGFNTIPGLDRIATGS